MLCNTSYYQWLFLMPGADCNIWAKIVAEAECCYRHWCIKNHRESYQSDSKLRFLFCEEYPLSIVWPWIDRNLPCSTFALTWPVFVSPAEQNDTFGITVINWPLLHPHWAVFPENSEMYLFDILHSHCILHFKILGTGFWKKKNKTKILKNLIHHHLAFN